MGERTTYVITLVDAGGADDPPVEVRLRHALKRFSRTYSLRCVRAVAEGLDVADASHQPGQEEPAGRQANARLSWCRPKTGL
jgi:hypothetical protein